MGSKTRRLSEAELAEKRSKNMCFWCDEKYGPIHVCKKKYLHTILVQECSEDRNDSLGGNEADGEFEQEEPIISLYAMGSLQYSGKQTMRLKGRH